MADFLELMVASDARFDGVFRQAALEGKAQPGVRRKKERTVGKDDNRRTPVVGKPSRTAMGDKQG